MGTFRDLWRSGGLALLAGICICAPAVAQTSDKACAAILLHGQAGGTQAMAALAKRVQGSCAVRTPEMPWSARRGDGGTGAEEIAREVKAMRQQGHKRIVLVGVGAGANAAMAYAGSAGDVEGVAALAPQDGAALPATAARILQHVPLLWVVSTADPLHAKGEAHAFAKAPPHPSSRYVAIKADPSQPENASRTVLDWIKGLD